MSWLFVAFVPALLMLATFGLDRLEAGLVDDAGSPADVAAALEQARADCARPALPRYRQFGDGDDHVDDGADYEAGYEAHFDPYVDRGDLAFGEPSTRLPARIYIHHRSNTDFLPTRQADRV